MKTNTTTKVAEYDRPEIEVIIIKAESVICNSPGENEDNTDDEL